MIGSTNHAHRTVPALRGRFGTEEPSLRPHRKGDGSRGRFAGRFTLEGVGGVNFLSPQRRDLPGPLLALNAPFPEAS